MKRENNNEHQENLNRWLVSYADLITLLFATFVILYALAQSDSNSLSRLQNSIRSAFSTSSGAGVLEDGKGIFDNKSTTSPINPFLLENISPAYEEESFDKIKKNIEDLKIKENMTGVNVKIDERGLSIIVDDNTVLFPSASAELSPHSKKILDNVGKIITDRFKTHQIRIEGHTDSLPINSYLYPSNWELSAARASAIVRYLISKFNMSADILSAIGYADTRPVIDNSNEKNRALNRRVEILIVRNKYKHLESLSRTILLPSKKDNIIKDNIRVEETYLKEQVKNSVLERPKFISQ